MDNLYYTIGEVSEMLGESSSLVRFWTNSFSRYLKPKRNAKGNRLYTQEEIEVLKQIHLLVKVQGMTLDGAAKKMSSDKKAVDGKVKVLESLRSIREQLVEVRKSL